MTTIPPKISKTELQGILDQAITIPEHVSESFITKELMHNRELSWKLNPFLLKTELLELFTGTNAAKQWQLLKGLNWVALILIVTYAIINKDFKLLWTIPIYIVLINSGILSLWIALSIAATVIGYGLLNDVVSHHFWFTVAIAAFAYALSKVSIATVERTMIRYAKTDTKTFWKFFSKQLIVSSNKSHEELTRLENVNTAIRTE